MADGFQIDVFLQPGEYYFGDADTRIRTLLGSCVSITLWHPLRRVGGMCHCLLPERNDTHIDQLDGRYVVEAFLLLLGEAARADIDPARCQIKLFGGANMFAARRGAPVTDIGRKNVQYATRLIGELGLTMQVCEVGGSSHRVLLFDVADGAVWMRNGDEADFQPLALEAAA